MTTRQLRTITSAMITWAVLCFAAQNVAHCQIELARELARISIPVLLTIQVDSIAKPWGGRWLDSPNVTDAVNFIRPAAYFMTARRSSHLIHYEWKIIGNFQMTYKDHPIECDAFPWFARTFMKSHIEIENDPRVWRQAASLIE